MEVLEQASPLNQEQCGRDHINTVKLITSLANVYHILVINTEESSKRRPKYF